MKRLLSQIQLVLYQMFPGRLGFLASLLWSSRDTIARQNANSGKIIWIEDSRGHQFEEQINEMSGHLCLSVSGSKIRNWLGKAKEYADLIKPRAIIIGLGGNNFRAKEYLTDVCDEMRALLSQLKGYDVFVYEITPVGLLDEVRIPGILEKIQAFCLWLRGEEFTNPRALHLIKVNDLLASNGVLDPEMDCGDAIHFTNKAWPIKRDRALGMLRQAGIE